MKTRCTHCNHYGHGAVIVGNYIRCQKRGWVRGAILAMFTAHQSRIRQDGSLRQWYPSLCISNTPKVAA